MTTLGFAVADMRHCHDTHAAQQVISAIEAQRNDLDSAVLRLADRGAFAAAGTRSNPPREALTSALREREFTFTLPSGDEQTGPVVVALPPYPSGAPALAKALAERNVSVGLGQGPLKGRALRFALYGQTEDSIAELVRELDAVVQTVAGEYL